MERFRPTVDSVSQTGGHTINPVNPNVSRPDLPASYQGLLDANPYMNLDYRESGWQKFLSSLGFRTGYDKRMEDMQLQAQEYNAQVANMAFQNEFNSPEVQASRMRAAGQNPDLLGTGDVAGAASMGEDMNPPAPSETDMQSVGQFANVVMSAFTTSMGLFKDLEGLNQIRTNIEAGNIANARETYNLALQAVLGASPANPFVDDSEHGSYLAAGITKQIADDAKASFGKGLSRKRRRYYESAVDQLVNSLPATKEQYAGWRDQMQNKISMFQTYNSPEYSPWEPALSSISKHLSKLAFRMKESGFERGIAVNEADTKQAENRSIYEGEIDPALAARTENEGNEAQRKQFSIQNVLKETLEDMTRDLRSLSKEGGLKGAFAELLLFGFSLMSLTNMNYSQDKGFSIGF